MLHLRRRVGEEIIINDDIRVTVLGIKGNQVQIGVTAPRSVPVDRKEIHDRRMGKGVESNLALAGADVTSSREIGSEVAMTGPTART